jgi:hypothetical protein
VVEAVIAVVPKAKSRRKGRKGKTTDAKENQN